MLNYRTSGKIAPQVSLSNILQDRFNPEDIRDRIVIIGTVAPSFNDHHWLTPYSYGYQKVQKMTGIEIQAQMVSQILSSVLDSQPLIWWLPNWGEGIWIFVWSTIGSLLVLNIQSSRYSILTIGITLIVVYGSCFLILTQGGWIPFIPTALALIVIVSLLALKLPPFQQS
ncbi:MAG: CHASE2 domain-containing protein [Microcoleaceae cyanobacterium]